MTRRRSSADAPQDKGTKRQPESSRSAARRAEQARRSALWAAYGDAIGFISELTDEAGLKRRTAGRPLDTPISWTRRIGGRGGVNARLPVGCYSDDTQLRLATSRAIGIAGFDAEAFAKVELPVWTSYALGGGTSSKTAAANLAKPTVAWFANTYKGWQQAGGNGAAMRVHPHVWAATDLADPREYIVDVMRNAVTTHGHPIGLVGAVLHALCTAAAMERGEVLTPKGLGQIVDQLGGMAPLLTMDAELADMWLVTWQRAARRSFDEAWQEATEEARVAVRLVEQPGRGSEGYDAVLRNLGLFEPARRGSALLTAIAAVALTWCEPSPATAMAIAANAIGSDTDTIATMAGALLGATTNEDPPVDVLDSELVVNEAERMASLATGRPQSGQRYPDLLTWNPPRTQADALVQWGGDLAVTGLGRVSEVLGDPLIGTQRDFCWRWVRLETGQTLFIKSRQVIPEIHPESTSERETRRHGTPGSGGTLVTGAATTAQLFDTSETNLPSGAQPNTAPSGSDVGDAEHPQYGTHPRQLELARVFAWLEEQGFQNEALGYALRRVARDGSTEQIASFLAILLERLRA